MIRCTLGYDTDEKVFEKIRTEAPEDFAIIAKCITKLVDDADGPIRDIWRVRVAPFWVTYEALPTFMKHSIHLVVAKKDDYEENEAVYNMMVRLSGFNRTEASEAIAGGNVINVHVPNAALLTYNEVTYLEDSCTDRLQSHLDDGWRILAVCPPHAQRRPDYILGRYNATTK